MAKEGTNDCGTVAVVLGILSIIFASAIGIILGITSLVFAIKQNKIQKNSWSKAGLILSIIGIILSIIAIIATFLLVKNSGAISQLLSQYAVQ